MKAFIAFATAAPLFVSQMAPQDDMDLPSQKRERGETTANAEQCQDTIHMVREERGLPTLDRGTANRDEPLFFAAVDHRIDGCSVLVMKDQAGDIRPLPDMQGRAPELIPAH